MRKRLSKAQEAQVWQLRCQGHTYASIASLLGIGPNLTPVVRRLRRQPPQPCRSFPNRLMLPRYIHP